VVASGIICISSWTSVGRLVVACCHLLAQVRACDCRLFSHIQSAAFINAVGMYRRSRSRSPGLGLLPQDQLRFAAVEARVLALEKEVTMVKKELAAWKRWELYLYQIYQWAVDVAAAFSRFPWDWAHTSKANTSHGSAADIV